MINALKALNLSSPIYRYEFAKEQGKLNGGEWQENLQRSQNEIIDFFVKSNYNIKEELCDCFYSTFFDPEKREEVIIEFPTAYHCLDKSRGN